MNRQGRQGTALAHWCHGLPRRLCVRGVQCLL